MNLNDFAEFSVPVTVHPERCIHTFSPRSSCKKCTRVCSTKGLKLESGHLPIVEECNGCGQCVQACPLDVFLIDFPEMVQQETEPLVLICRRNQISDTIGREVHCLQQFTWLELAQLLTQHQDVYLFSDEALCNDCECQWFPIGQTAMLERNGFGYLNERLHIIRSRVAYDALFKREEELNSRRQYLKNQLQSIKLTSKNFATKTIEGYSDAMVQTISQREKPLFEKSQSMSMKVYHLLKKDEVDLDAEMQFEKLTCSRCNFCKACEQLCPWEAIAIVEEEGHAVLAYHDVLCSRCGLCVDLCPTKGLFWNQGLRVANFTEPRWRLLAEAEEKICDRCGEPFYTTNKNQVHCAICENKL